MSAMFDDDEGRRLGQIEDLAGAVADGHFQYHGRTAGRARARKVIDGLVGLGDLEQSFPLMAFLSARRSSRWLA
jgi:predicted phosphodiesterase